MKDRAWILDSEPARHEGEVAPWRFIYQYQEPTPLSDRFGLREILGNNCRAEPFEGGNTLHIRQ